MATSFVDEGVNVFVAITVKSGIKMYANHKMIPNRNWTIGKMMAKARDITGKKFGNRDYDEAVRCLESWIDINGTRAQEKGQIRG